MDDNPNVDIHPQSRVNTLDGSALASSQGFPASFGFTLSGRRMKLGSVGNEARSVPVLVSVLTVPPPTG